MIAHGWPSRRFSLVGTIGCGKSTCAREISTRLGIPHIELDSLHWGRNWTEEPAEVFRRRVLVTVQNESWVVDGNYHQVRDLVWSRADTLVWLDYPFRFIMWRLSRRTLMRIVTRERLWHDNQENLRSLFTRDSVFLWALKTYRKRRREYPKLLVRNENRHLKLVRLKSPGQTEVWLRTLS
jgi:adenylate kinase family enzyme